MSEYAVDLLLDADATATTSSDLLSLEVQLDSISTTGELSSEVALELVLDGIVEMGLSSGGTSYNFGSPAGSWPIQHNLGRYPVVQVIVSGEIVFTDITHIDTNNLVVVFAVPQSGTAILV